MMTPTRATGGAWISGSSSMRLSASIPGLEDDPRWRPIPSCPSPTSNEHSLMKDGLPPSSSFSKGMLDEEWYMTPESSLMDEMKELSYASSLASQADNVSSAHFNLDSPHLQSFLSRNASRPPNNLSAFLDGGLPFDGMSNFSRQSGSLSGLGGNAILDSQSGSGTSNPLDCPGGTLLQNAHANALGNRQSSGLLSNLSPKPTPLVSDGFDHSLAGNLSSILTSFPTSSGPGGASSQGNNNNNNLSSILCTFPTSAGPGAGSSQGNHNNNTTSPFSGSSAPMGGFGDGGFTSSLNGGRSSRDNSMLLSAPFPSKMRLAALDEETPLSSTSHQQTLFQKRAALRHSRSGGAISPTAKFPPRLATSASNDSSVDMPDEESPNIRAPHQKKKTALLPPGSSRVLPAQLSGGGMEEMGEFAMEAEHQQQRGFEQEDGKEEDDMEESGDGSGVLYETDDTMGMEGAQGGQGGGMVHCGLGGGGEKGKGKKGLPAKNLMAERRRRKKLNDRLYMLRSVVPKITKMDRASILGDAIEYLKELLQRINDLHTELETIPVERPSPPSPPGLPPVTTSLACRVKEESPSSLPSPDVQPARVEVRTREGKALNIHMFCERRPGLLLSTMRALDGLGLDVQQAVISCFNGFALDVFKAEQSKEAEVGPEEIRAVLLHTAGSNLSTLS